MKKKKKLLCRFLSTPQQIITPRNISNIRVFLLSNKQPPKNIQFYNAPV